MRKKLFTHPRQIAFPERLDRELVERAERQCTTVSETVRQLVAAALDGRQLVEWRDA